MTCTPRCPAPASTAPPSRADGRRPRRGRRPDRRARVPSCWPRAGVAVPAVVVADPRAVLGARRRAASTARPADELRMVGITGTNGKTTTAYLVDAGLRAARPRDRPGRHGRDPGRRTSGSRACAPPRRRPTCTRCSRVMRERGVDACAMEVSSHALALGRVDGRSSTTSPRSPTSPRTTWTSTATMEEYFAAKAPPVHPARAPARRRLRRRRVGPRGWPPRPTVPGGHRDLRAGRPDADWRAERRRRRTGRHASPRRPRRAGCALRSRAARALQRRQHRRWPRVVLAAGGVADADAVRGVAAVPRVPGPDGAGAARGQDRTSAVVDFAHTPDAVAAALRALRPPTAGPARRRARLRRRP